VNMAAPDRPMEMWHMQMDIQATPMPDSTGEVGK
jgi:hypothetical protein